MTYNIEKLGRKLATGHNTTFSIEMVEENWASTIPLVTSTLDDQSLTGRTQ